MKRWFNSAILPLFFLSILLSRAEAQSDWQEVPSTVTNELKAVDFSSPSVGFAVGASGTIVGTTDGGATWSALESGSGKNLWSVACFAGGPSNRVIAAGDGGEILVSNDQGITWERKPSGIGPQDFLFGIQVFDPRTLYIAGGRFVGPAGQGVVLKSVDAGETWSLLSAPQAFFLDRVCFNDPMHGIAVGLSSSLTGGVILTTSDGGTTWSERLTPAQVVAGLACVSPTTAYAVGGGGQFFRTNDGGATWITPDPAPGNGDLLGVSFTSPTDGAIAGAGVVLETTNGGVTWSTGWNGAQTMNAVFASPATALRAAVGTGGIIVRKNASLGIQNISNRTSDVRQYPNPSSGTVTFSSSIGSDLAIVDALGRQVHVAHIDSGLPLTLPHLSPGTYHWQARGTNTVNSGCGKFLVH